jgi:hypothetical protein
MGRKVLIKKRINLEAWKMKTFTANQLMDKVNNYPNMDGRGRTRHLRVTVFRLTNLLKQNPNIEYIPANNHKRAGMWKWIGDEEE